MQILEINFVNWFEQFYSYLIRTVSLKELIFRIKLSISLKLLINIFQPYVISDMLKYLVEFSRDSFKKFMIY